MSYDHWKTTEPIVYDDDEDEFWCEECQNTGSIDCHCGGDLCVCEYYGEKPCPKCS